MDLVIQKVASYWIKRLSRKTSGIPGWVFDRYQTRESFQSDPRIDEALYQTARESVNALIPTFLAYLRKHLGDRYTLNASSRRTDIYYFFAPPQPIDSVAMHLGVKGAKVRLDLSYSPSDLQGNRAPEKMREVREVIEDPELAGIYMMRMLRKVLS
jgi:hypothetical protein